MLRFCARTLPLPTAFARHLHFSHLTASSSLEANTGIFTSHGVLAFRLHGAAGPRVDGWRSAAVAAVDKYIQLARRAPGGFGLKKEGGFREIVEKDVGRFDLNMDHVSDSGAHTAAHADVAFISEVRAHAERVAQPLLRQLFGPDYILNGKGCVISFPGTSAQDWHVDSSHLFTQQQLRAVSQGTHHLPCHFVTVFVPLYAARPDLGPTQFMTGTSSLTLQLPNAEVADQYPPEPVVAQLARAAGGGGGEGVTMECEVGDVVVMDGRTLHRGLANRSRDIRPLCYFSFCPPWYREWPRSHNEGRSLFGGRDEAGGGR